MARGKRGMEFRKEALNSQVESDDNHLLTKNTMITNIPQFGNEERGLKQLFFLLNGLALAKHHISLVLFFFFFFLKDTLKERPRSKDCFNSHLGSDINPSKPTTENILLKSKVTHDIALLTRHRVGIFISDHRLSRYG